MINYFAYICNNFFSHFGYAPYPKFSLISMTKDIPSQKQFCPKKIQYTLKLYFIIYIMYSMHSQKTTEDPQFSEGEFSL